MFTSGLENIDKRDLLEEQSLGERERERERERMKKCELCDSVAKMFCESDQASLCWDCDIKVHGANFLVAKHTRTLLCHVCQSLTPWNASGPKLGPTVSVCQKCVNSSNKESRDDEEEEEHDDDADDDADADDEEEENSVGEDDDYDGGDNGADDNDGGNDDEEEENQVVPWSSSSSSPPNSSSLSDEECCHESSFSKSRSSYPSKRRRYNAHLNSQPHNFFT